MKEPNLEPPEDDIDVGDWVEVGEAVRFIRGNYGGIVRAVIGPPVSHNTWYLIRWQDDEDTWVMDWEIIKEGGGE